MAKLFIDIEELTVNEDQALSLLGEIETLVKGKHPKATIEFNGDTEYDENEGEGDED